MVLGKLPVPGRPTNLDYSRAGAYCTCIRCGRGLLDIFSLVYHISFLSPSLWETARYRLKYCLKGPLSPKTTNQPITDSVHIKVFLQRKTKFSSLPFFSEKGYNPSPKGAGVKRNRQKLKLNDKRRQIKLMGKGSNM